MTISLRMPEVTELKPHITVFGVGGAGGNAVANMIRSELLGVEFVVANTDAQALAGSPADRRIQLGASMTQGLGAGSRPDVGAGAAEESMEEILSNLGGAHMVFITAGMGGGTGTGAAPVIARAAREQGILTVGVVTKPFHFEGQRRMRTAEAGIAELQKYVDTLIIIPNQNLFRIANEKTTFAQAFALADEVLHAGVRGITDLMVMPGLINLDFADIRTVMNEMGKAMMGTGEAEGANRATEAAEAAISNPLLDEVSMKGARGVLIHITGGMDLTLFEVDEAANRIRSEVDPDANIIVGSTFHEALEGRMRVSVVATGIEVDEAQRPLDLPEHQGHAEVHQRRIRPLASSASVVTQTYSANPVKERIQELEERVQSELPPAPAPAREVPVRAEPVAQRPVEREPVAERRAAPERAAPPVAPQPAREAPSAHEPHHVALGGVERPGAPPATESDDDLVDEREPRIRKRAPNFFQRMTAGGILGGGAGASGQAAQPTVQAPRVERDSAPEVTPPRRSTRAAAGERSGAASPQRNKEDAVTERSPALPLDEEQLEIPAFLRRQAH